MSFPALSQLGGLIPNSSHQNLNVLPSHIQVIYVFVVVVVVVVRNISHT